MGNIFQDLRRGVATQGILQACFGSQYSPQTGGRGNSVVTRLQRLETGEIRQRRGEIQPSDGQYSRGSIGNLDGSVQGNIDTRSSDVRKLGSVPPTVTDGFAVTYTDTTANIYWDGTNGSNQIQIRRADGTYLVIPPNSLAITGLVASTQYYMVPFWSTNAEGDGCGNVGWVTGDSGSPMFCMLNITVDQLAAQLQQGREALAHPALTFTTGAPAAGPAQTTSGGGSASSGASGVDSSGIIHPSVL